MYRQYREGELPDIQIKYSELIRPLQALAQVRLRDPGTLGQDQLSYCTSEIVAIKMFANGAYPQIISIANIYYVHL